MAKSWSDANKPVIDVPRRGTGGLTLTEGELALAKNRIEATDPAKIAAAYRELWRNVAEAVLAEDYEHLSEKQYAVIKINYEIQSKANKRKSQWNKYTDSARFNSFYNQVGRTRNW